MKSIRQMAEWLQPVGVRLLIHTIYTILQEECGATDYWRENFVHEIENGCREYRFQGNLGFGGKLYLNREDCRVGYYPEDKTKERESMQEKANARLQKLLKENKNPYYEEDQ